MPKLLIAPSILSADFGKLNEEIKMVERVSDMFHVDVMDGHFVSNITIGAPVVAKVQTTRPLVCHLMIEHPEKYVDDFVKAGAWMIMVHVEACGRNLPRVLRMIQKKGVRAAVAINPGTPVSKIASVIDIADAVLVMSVWPGFGGQKFIQGVVPKIKKIRQLKPELDIHVDGGITDETAKIVKAAGANVLVSGSFIFGSKNRLKSIASLRRA